MSVYLQRGGTTYLYDFWYKKQRYTGSTGQIRKEDAELREGKIKLELRQRMGGVMEFDRLKTPSFTEFAGIYYDTVTGKPSAETIEQQLRVVLRFWGAKPGDPARVDPDAPYHDLRLADPLLDPMWLEKFDQWIVNREVSAQTRMHYLSRCSALYRLILKKPVYRQRYGIERNPFLDLERGKKGRKTVALDADQLRSLIEHASYHVRLAIAIGALAPELRKSQVLGLRWSQHVSSDFAWFKFPPDRHKTGHDSGKPMVVPIVAQLMEILKDAQLRDRQVKRGTADTARRKDYVILYQGRPISDIRTGVKNAAIAAGLPYGRDIAEGMTFHSLRHSAATLMAELDIQESKRMIAMGHTQLQTTQHYTHLRPVGKRVTLEQVSAALPMADLVTHVSTKATRTKKRA